MADKNKVEDVHRRLAELSNVLIKSTLNLYEWFDTGVRTFSFSEEEMKTALSIDQRLRSETKDLLEKYLMARGFEVVYYEKFKCWQIKVNLSNVSLNCDQALQFTEVIKKKRRLRKVVTHNTLSA